MDGGILTPGTEPTTEKQPEDRKRFRKMPAEEKLALIKHMFVVYPRLGEIRRLIHECRYVLRGDDDEAPGLLITGPSGSGKTYLIKRTVRESPPRDTETGREVRIVHANVSAPATIPGICSKILARLGDPCAERGSIANMTARIQRNLVRCKTEFLFLDEFQHFIDRDSQKILRTVSDWLKNLISEMDIPIGLVGLENCYEIFDERNEQLNRRFAFRRVIEPFSWDTKLGQLEVRRVLHLIDKSLPFEEMANLADPEIALVIFTVSRGRMGTMMKLIKHGARLVVRRAGDRLTMQDLADAYQQVLWSPHRDAVNPFSAARLLKFRHSGEKNTMVGVGKRLLPKKNEPDPFKK